MKRNFTAIIRDGSGTGTLEVTVPHELVSAMNLKAGQICILTIELDEEAEKIIKAK